MVPSKIISAGPDNTTDDIRPPLYSKLTSSGCSLLGMIAIGGVIFQIFDATTAAATEPVPQANVSPSTPRSNVRIRSIFAATC